MSFQGPASNPFQNANGFLVYSPQTPMGYQRLIPPYLSEQKHPKDHEFYCMLGFLSPLLFETILDCPLKFMVLILYQLIF